jgi:hypothetical protein
MQKHHRADHPDWTFEQQQSLDSDFLAAIELYSGPVPI